MELKVYLKNDPILREPTEKVANFDMELQTLIDNMVKTMRENSGIGLSAPQVGARKKIIMGEFEGDKKEQYKPFPLAIICNPKIERLSNEQCRMVEGCLSFPGVELVIKRPKRVTVTGQDRYGKPIKIEDDNLLSRVVQHEIDHLNSTLLIDHLEKVRVIFFGSGSFGLEALKMMAKDPQYQIASVVTTFGGMAIERGNKIEKNPAKELAKKLKLPLFTVKTLKDKKAVAAIKKLKPELGVVCDFGLIIPQNIIDIPKNGILNIHPSLLPEFRGPTPIQSTILSGAKRTGVSIILINQKVDAGPIIARAKAKITPTTNYQVLKGYLAKVGATLLLNSIPYYLTGELKPVKQNENKATLTKMITKKDGEVDKKTPAEIVERKIRAYSEWPKVYTIINNRRIQLIAAHYDRENKLVIDRVKPEGKNEMSYEDFRRGYHQDLTFPQ